MFITWGNLTHNIFSYFKQLLVLIQFLTRHQGFTRTPPSPGPPTCGVRRSSRAHTGGGGGADDEQVLALIKLFSFSSDKDRRTDSCGFVAQWLERVTRIRKILGSIPGGAALCFFRLIRLSVLLSLSELKEKSLIRNDPDKSEFTIEVLTLSQPGGHIVPSRYISSNISRTP